MTRGAISNRAGVLALAGTVIIVLLASCGIIGGRPGPAGSPSRPGVPLGPPYRIGNRVQGLVEVNGNYGPRTLQVDIRYPARSGRLGTDNPGAPAIAAAFPLVVFAPGYLQCGSAYAPLLRSWAAAGFVVAAVRFPFTDCGTASPQEWDVVNQPADVSYVITRLLDESASSRSPLHGLIDQRRIAVAGQSDGGDTVAADAFSTCCRDHHVTAAVILAGAELATFGGSYFPPGSPPGLFVQGTSDLVNPPANTEKLYGGDGAGPKALLMLPGAGHFPPYEGDGPAEQLVARVTTSFLQLIMLGSRTAGRSMMKEGNIRGRSVLTTSGMPAGASAPPG
jgi:pimeloyl-ACP methyl ester carboxylesterase